ncbi:MAG: efflux RND transporter periplasmic adaptor subunit [Candidatus Aerophobus sp.]|nr:MAG: efflux RND transporter periplasmic adaptor subunit [Candidatus Aerophobus sp.]
MYCKIVSVGMLGVMMFCLPGISYSQEKKGIVAAVKITAVKKGQIGQELSLTADIGPQSSVTIVPKVSGTLEEIKVKLGDRVKQGEVIAKIESREFLLGVKQAEAAFSATQTQWNLAKATAQTEFFSNLAQVQSALKVAQANLDKIRKGAREEEIERVDAAYQQALANAQTTEKDLNRARDNYEKGAISDQQFDGAQLQFKVAQAGLESAKANLDLIKKGAREEDIKVVEAQVEQTQASLKNLESLKEAKSWEAKIKGVQAQAEQAEVALGLAKIRLEDCTIKAPISGIISKRFVDVGAMVGPTQPLVSIVDIDTVKLLTHVSDEDLDKVKLTQEVEVKVGTYLNRSYEVKEINISPVMDPLSRKIEVKINISNPDYLLKPGMFPKIKLWGEKENVLLVPKGAVLKKEGKEQVFVVQDNRAYLQKVIVGLEKDGLVQIMKGLKEGDQVVISGQIDLNSGDPVVIE